MLRRHRREEREVFALSGLYVSLAAIGGLLLLLGLLGGLLKERTPLSEPLIALIAGVLIGPAIFGLLDLADLGDETLILEEAALVTLGVALVGVALRLPVGYASSNWRLLVVLLGIVMPLMWVASGLLVYLILGLPFLGFAPDRDHHHPNGPSGSELYSR
jgi:sodium/hydrogen antiporter